MNFKCIINLIFFQFYTFIKVKAINRVWLPLRWTIKRRSFQFHEHGTYAHFVLPLKLHRTKFMPEVKNTHFNWMPRNKLNGLPILYLDINEVVNCQVDVISKIDRMHTTVHIRVHKFQNSSILHGLEHISTRAYIRVHTVGCTFGMWFDKYSHNMYIYGCTHICHLPRSELWCLWFCVPLKTREIIDFLRRKKPCNV